MDEIAKVLGPIIGAAAMYIVSRIADWWKHKQAKKLNSNGIEQFNETDKVVRHSAVHCFVEHEATRVYVMHFTNGTRTEAGVHLQRLTFMHERTREPHIEKLTPFNTAIPLPDLWYNPIKMVRSTKDKDYYIQSRSELKDKEDARELYDWMVHYAIESMYLIGLRNKLDIVVAVYCIHFDRPDPLSPEDKFDLREERNKIESVYNSLK